MPDAQRLVQDFCDLMVKRDAEAMRPFLADDVVYQNTGMLAASGIDAVIENLAGQFAMIDCYEYKTINIVADGDTVMTERLDFVRGADGNKHGLPVMGTFVVRDRKIVRWTDYWDTGLVGKMMAGQDYSALVPSY
jgi:limonene-1,2-epoxide hydrolase